METFQMLLLEESDEDMLDALDIDELDILIDMDSIEESAKIEKDSRMYIFSEEDSSEDDLDKEFDNLRVYSDTDLDEMEGYYG